MAEQSELRQQISQAGAEGAMDARSSGLIGYVLNYHREASTCQCKRHKGESIEAKQRHTVDVEVYMGQKKQVFNEVPCFVYGTGIMDHGLAENDRVWIQFLNGDQHHPIVTAYYRDPTQWDIIMNDVKNAVPDFFSNIGNSIGTFFGG